MLLGMFSFFCLFTIRVKAKQPQVLNKSMINGEYAKTEAGFKELSGKIPGIENWMLSYV